MGKCYSNFIHIQASLFTVYTHNSLHAHSAEWSIELLKQAGRNKYPLAKQVYTKKVRKGSINWAILLNSILLCIPRLFYPQKQALYL